MTPGVQTSKVVVTTMRKINFLNKRLEEVRGNQILCQEAKAHCAQRKGTRIRTEIISARSVTMLQ
jgi:hypothetical protein